MRPPWWRAAASGRRRSSPSACARLFQPKTRWISFEAHDLDLIAVLSPRARETDSIQKCLEQIPSARVCVSCFSASAGEFRHMSVVEHGDSMEKEHA
jgi:hypothetical protein